MKFGGEPGVKLSESRFYVLKSGESEKDKTPQTGRTDEWVVFLFKNLGT